jgi:glycosyltransferase involved in cell wall biosynthesis
MSTAFAPAAPASVPPFVSVAMPCLDEERFIEACIRSVQAQDYPAERIEILVADGGSRDATLAILGRLAAEDPRIRVLDNPERLQTVAMNRMIRAARGEVVARMDVHCEYAPSYLRKCVETLAATGADNVGGAQRARAGSRFQRALVAALESSLGMGGAAYRSAAREGEVDTVFLGAFRREVFERVGLFDPGAVTNEDAELNQRLLDAGGRIWLSPEIEVHYHPRESWPALARQYFRYGMGRARTLLKHRRLPKLRPLAPFALVVGSAALALTSPWQPLTPFVLAAYLAACAFEAVRVGRRAGWSSVPLVFILFPTLHFAHGLGFARGLVRYARRPDWVTARGATAPVRTETA